MEDGLSQGYLNPSRVKLSSTWESGLAGPILGDEGICAGGECSEVVFGVTVLSTRHRDVDRERRGGGVLAGDGGNSTLVTPTESEQIHKYFKSHESGVLIVRECRNQNATDTKQVGLNPCYARVMRKHLKSSNI